jgi:tetratricopeptide (TPR) repeat protein
MTNDGSTRDRHLALIDEIVQLTLKGKIRSKEQVYRMLAEGVEIGTGELFERALGDRLVAAQRQVDIQTDELKQAKAERTLRALKTIHTEWDRWQQQAQVNVVLNDALQQLIAVPEGDRLIVLLHILDPNLPKPLNLNQWQTLAQRLLKPPFTDNGAESSTPLSAMARGILQGIAAWQRLEDHLVSWIYDQSKPQLGFEGVGQRGPWQRWAKEVKRDIPQQLFQTLALEQSVVEWVEAIASESPSQLDIQQFVEIVVILRSLQLGLVNWFDKLVYDSKVGAKLSIATFLAFAILWSQLANGLLRSRLATMQPLADAAVQMTLQLLRTFAQRDYFPLYGGIFLSFSGQYLRDALTYLDEPLRQAEGTQEKARILTLLAYSAQAQGRHTAAQSAYQDALLIAQKAGDVICEVAILNHLSRFYLGQSRYDEAIHTSERALILSRQTGDRLGEANALANLGYSEVFKARQLERIDPEQQDMALHRLESGLALAEKLGDRQSQALCLSSLGIAHVMVENPKRAIAYLESGIHAAQFTADLYLQGMNFTYLAEAYHQLQQTERTLYYGSVGMYLLEQIGSTSAQQAASLLTIVRGSMGQAACLSVLSQQRANLIQMISADGYDHVLAWFKQSD